MTTDKSASPNESPGNAAQSSIDAESSFLTQSKNMFEEHKGKLAIGVAATLGAMIFYNWLERQIAKNDPEDYARIKRLKAVVKAGDADTGTPDTPPSTNVLPQSTNPKSAREVPASS